MIYLIDSAAILNNINFSFDPGKKYLTTSGVVGEIRDFRSRAVVDNAFKQNLLKIKEPSEESLKKIREKAAETRMRLSETDLSLIALAFEYKKSNKRIEVITDDYSVQNLLLELKVPFSSVIRGEITEFRKNPKPAASPDDPQ